jgi:hypothetical protein
MLKSSHGSSWNAVDDVHAPHGWKVIDRVVLVSRAHESSVRLGVPFVEDDVGRRLRVVHPSSPRRKHRDVQPSLLGLAHDEIDVIPVVVLRRRRGIGARRDRRARRVAAEQRQIAVRVRYGEPVELREQDSLDRRVPLVGAELEIPHRIVTREAMKQFPPRVAEIEVGPSVLGDEKVAVLAGANAQRRARRRPLCGGRRDSTQRGAQRRDSDDLSEHAGFR